jgi:hypothetical protein
VDVIQSAVIYRVHMCVMVAATKCIFNCLRGPHNLSTKVAIADLDAELLKLIDNGAKKICERARKSWFFSLQF